MILNTRTFVDFAALFCVFVASLRFGGSHTELNPETLLGVLILITSWFCSTALTRKFNQTYQPESLTDRLAPFVKGSILMLAFVTIFQQVFAVAVPLVTTAFAFSLVEMLVISALLFSSIEPDWLSAAPETDQHQEKIAQVDLALDGAGCAEPVDASALLSRAEFQSAQSLGAFIDRAIGHSGAGGGTGCVLPARSSDEDAGQISLGVSQVRLNDVRRMNKYLLGCYARILPGGWLLVRYTPLDGLISDLKRKSFGKTRCLAHFLFHRVWPRLPRVNGLYFALTRGRNRALSKAEVWGRLHFCGFEVLDEIRSDGLSHVVARKTRTPCTDRSPSYYPVIKLARVGKGGKIVPVYKVRSMHPYSEYIQKKIFEQNSLDSKGKFQDDFRRTGWGIFLRKHWLDEIPQLLDWLRGDLKLVGICAMSEHYFSLYSAKYQELFKRVKPGVVPPLMDEDTQGFKQIQEIEQTYLESYLEHPLRTDITYLWRTFSQIALKGGRSG